MSDPLAVRFAVQSELLGHGEEFDSESRRCFDHYNDSALFELFHLTRPCLEFVVDMMRVCMKKKMQLSPLSLDAMILVTLNFYARGFHSSSILKRFDLNTDCEDIVLSVSDVVAGLSEQFISFPQTHKAKVGIAHMVEDFCGIPNTLGLLIPAHFRLTDGARELCVNSMGYTSVVSQMICDLDGNILSVEQCCAGSTRERDLWGTSLTGREIEEELYGRYWVVGGECYNLSKRVLTPVTGPKTDSQRNYNVAHAKLYKVAQNMLRCLKWRFRCLTQLGFAQHKLTKIIKVCCVLHNIAKKFSVPMPHGMDKFQDPQPNNLCGEWTDICPDALRARHELIEYNFSVVKGQGEEEFDFHD
ncbi:putative nuclease HARBI1 [Stigmatopora nigra]